MKKSSVLQNKRVARQRNRRLKRRQRSFRQWLARMAKVRHSLASLTAAREPAAAGARGFYKGGPPPRKRSPTVERLLWSGNVEYRVFPQNFGGQPLRKQRPLAITEAPARLPLTPSSLVERVIVCSEADFPGDHRQLSPLSSPVSVGWGPLPEVGALRVITPAPEPDRLFSAQFQSRARGQAGSGSFALAELPENPWPLETHTPAPLKSRCSRGDPSASWAGCYQGKLTVIALEGTEKPIAVDDSIPSVEQSPSSSGRKKTWRETLGSNNFFREGTKLNRLTKYPRRTRGIGKLCYPRKRLCSQKIAGGIQNWRYGLGGPRGASNTSLRKHGLLRTLLKEAQTPNRDGGSSNHFTLFLVTALSQRRKPRIAVCNEVFGAKEYLRRNVISGQATTHLDNPCGIKKSYRLYKKPSFRKALSGAKNQCYYLGKSKAAIPRVGDRLGAAGVASLKKRELLQTVLRETRNSNREGGSGDHFTLLPLSAVDDIKRGIKFKQRGFKDLPRHYEESVVEEDFQEHRAENRVTMASTRDFLKSEFAMSEEDISPEVLTKIHQIRQEIAAFLATGRFNDDSRAGLPGEAFCSECQIRPHFPISPDDATR